jgi:tetratricopeptide (TPR) repeat protein
MAIKRDKILKSAEKLVQKGKLDQAIKEYEKLLKAQPEDTNTVNRLGDLYGRVGEIDKAVSLYEKVAEQFADQGFVPKAIAIYKKINRLAPQRLDIFERLGELYVEQGLMVEAKSQFQMLAEHYAKNDDLESAIRVHKSLTDIDPSDSTSRLKFADLLLESGNAEQAMGAYGALGHTLIQRDQIDEAERLFRRLLDHGIPNGEIMVPICDRLLDLGRVTSAQELLTAGLAVSGESVPLRTLQVRASMALGETDAAVKMAREILEVDPDNPDVRGLVGNALISEGDEAEAAEMMIPAAEALLEKADYSRAQKMLRELVEIAPNDERVLRLAIRAFRPSGDQEMLTRLTASLAEVCYQSGQEDQAKRFYLELVAAEPTNELYRERLAQIDGAVGHAADAMDTSGFGSDVPSEISFTLEGDEDAVASTPADDLPLAFDPAERINEAAVFAKYGLSDKAVKHLEGVIERLPDHAEARQALAEVYVSIGQRDKAGQTIAPVIEKLRASGDPDAAADLERRFGSHPKVADEDDEVIIVEIDGDEIADTTLEEAVSETVGASDAWATGEEVSIPVETTVVDDEMVEISAEADGPSFNDLAQLDLFIDQELFEDAVQILGRLEGEYPGDPDLAERRRKLGPLAERIDAVEDTAEPAPPSEPVAPPSPAPTPEIPPSETSTKIGAPSARIFGEEEPGEYIDLAKELEAELAEEEAMVEEATGRGKGEALLDEVFKEFQKGVAEQLSEEDSDTHFNLGIAYKEMGLLEEAIGEFQVASHDPAFFVEACSMIGVCANELGRHHDAAAWYQKALVAPDLSIEARTALRYELASALEKTGEIDQAVGLFEEIQSHDPAYRDVGARLASLSQQQRQIN